MWVEIEEWLVAARGRGARASTLVTRRHHLVRLARSVPASSPWDVTAGDLLGYWHGQAWAAETRRGHRASLRAFYAWGVEAGYVGVSPAEVLPRVPASTPRPRPAPDQAYRIALAGAGPRERLILRLAAEVGLRRAEVAQVHARDLVEDLTGWSLVVHGKGGRERVLPLPAGLAAELGACGPGWVFPGEDGGHLSPRWVGTLVARLLPEGWTMHTLRHRFATRAYGASGHDLAAVQDLLGHADPKTTRIYVAVDRSRLREVVEAAA